MKKILQKISVATIILMATVGNSWAPESDVAGDACQLIEGLSGVFKTLQILAFIGAAFSIAGWAWGFISKGEAKMEDVKKNGIGLLVGFALLFGVAIIIRFLPGTLNCPGGGGVF
jgi:hypothetical protein